MSATRTIRFAIRVVKELERANRQYERERLRQIREAQRVRRAEERVARAAIREQERRERAHQKALRVQAKAELDAIKLKEKSAFDRRCAERARARERIFNEVVQ